MSLSLVIKLTRWWVRVYTAGLRADRRDARRAEIDSDIWEQQRYAEATGTGHGLTALLMVERLLLSVPTDLLWRLSLGGSERRAARAAVIAAGKSGSAVAVVAVRSVIGLGVAIAATVLVIVGVLAWEGLVVSDRGPSVPAAVSDPEIKSLVDRAIQRTGQFSGAVLVSRGKDVLISKGYGMADYENGVWNTARTVFPVWGLTEMFTSMAVMQLQERGLVDVDQPIRRYLPDYPGGELITVHHLLTHSSGIPGYIHLLYGDDASIHEIIPQMHETFPTSLEELVGLFKSSPVDFAPGEMMEWSESNYVLLRQIIEETSGKPYEAYVEDRILQPLGMSNTSYCRAAAGTVEYRLDLTAARDYIPHTTGRDGFTKLCTTVEDMYRWSRGLVPGELVSEESLSAMFAPHTRRPNNDMFHHVGYEWKIVTSGSRDFVVHSGGGAGSGAWVRWYPEDEVFVALLTNRELEPGFSEWTISGVLADVAFLSE